ncbi:hypothetical protein MASR2M54_18710 [Aliarcobacter cryaerophilus]
MLFFGVLISAGAGAGAFSILIGTVSKSIPAQKRSFAAGFINAGGSFGQFVYAPITQAFINLFGWIWALIALAFSTLLSIPLAKKLTNKKRKQLKK